MAELGRDYNPVQWTTDARDEEGHLIWHERFPENDEWERIRTYQIDFNPGGDPVIRNVPISPDVPLAPYGSDGYTIDELVDFQLDIGSPPLSALG